MSPSVLGVHTPITVKRDLVDTHLLEAWTSVSQIAPEPHPRCLVHLKRGDRQLVPVSDPRAGSLFLGVLWVSLSFLEMPPVHPTRKQHDRLNGCWGNGMWVTAPSPLGGPYGSPGTGHDPQHMGCFQGKQNLAPLCTLFPYGAVKPPPLQEALTSSWDLYPCYSKLQNKHITAGLASTVLGLSLCLPAGKQFLCGVCRSTHSAIFVVLYCSCHSHDSRN